MTNVFDSAGNLITLNISSPLGSGGEGDVYNIISPASLGGYCIKLYNSNLASSKENKILFMKNNPPPNVESSNYRICWVKDAIYNHNSKFVGFLMQKAYSNSQVLYDLCHSDHALQGQWQKFRRHNNDGILRRFKLCVNLAIAFHSIHRLNSYVLVDLKPQNVLVTPDGRISVIDMDSIQISIDRDILFSSRVATADYTPPEGFQQLRPGKDWIPETWDRFSMGVIFYQILFGVHPYASTLIEEYKDSSTIAQKIQLGFFPLGANAAKVKVVPPPHHNFHRVSKSIQQLFLCCFEEGHLKPLLRPTAERWGQQFYMEAACPSQLQSHRTYMRKSNLNRVPVQNYPNEKKVSALLKSTFQSVVYAVVIIGVLILIALLVGC